MIYFNTRVLMNTFFSKSDILIPVFPSPKSYGRCKLEAFLVFPPRQDYSIDMIYDLDKDSTVYAAISDIFEHPFQNQAYLAFIISNNQNCAVHIIHFNNFWRIFRPVTNIIQHPENLSDFINLKRQELENCYLRQNDLLLDLGDVGLIPDPTRLAEMQALQEEERKLEQENIRAVAVSTNPHTVYHGCFVGQTSNLSLSSYPFSECMISFTPHAKRPWKISICNSFANVVGETRQLEDPRDRLKNNAERITAELKDSMMLEFISACDNLLSKWETGSLTSFNGVKLPSCDPLYTKEIPDETIDE